MLSEIFKSLYKEFKNVKGIEYYAERESYVVAVNSIYIELYMNGLTFPDDSSAKEFELELIKKIRAFTNQNIGNGYEVIYNDDWQKKNKEECKIKILKIILSCDYTITE